MATLKKQFLDYAGLQQFWGIIDAKFANKTDAAKVGSFVVLTKDEQNAPYKSDLLVAYTDSSTDANGYSFTLPAATNTHAGLLSANDKSLIDNINNKINDMAPFHGLKLGNKEVSLTGKRANIGLHFDNSQGSVADGTRQAFIELVDLDYPTGTWTSIEKAEYVANSDKVNYHAYEDKTVTPANVTYWRWDTTGAPVAGPINNLGAPITEKAISRIDVSELVKAGLLRDADVIVKDGVMYLQLMFITEGDNDKEVLVNITDLVDVYDAGEGINIVPGAINADGNSRQSEIKLDVAKVTTDADGNVTANTLGGIRVGYTTDNDKQAYKVQLDANGNAFVAVPWEHTTVSATSNGTGSGDKKYLTVNVTPTTETVKDVNGNDIVTRNFDVNVEAGEGIKNAEKLAGTSIQTITVGAVTADGADSTVKVTSSDSYIELGMVEKIDGDFKLGRDITLELTDSAKDSLALADTAVQGVTTTTVKRGGVGDNDGAHTPTGNDLVVALVTADGEAYGSEKGEKTIKITLGDKTVASLNKADTALQTIKIMGTDIDIDDEDGYTAGEAKKALALGSASNVNIATAMPDFDATDANDAQFKSDVTYVDFATMTDKTESQWTVPTTKVVKGYVDAEISTLDQNLRGHVQTSIEALNSTATVGVNNEYVYDDLYKLAYGSETKAQQIMVGVEQANGKLVEAATPHTLSVSDIADFAPISAAQITALCSGTANA
jgi:hypothetical protein